MHTRDAEAVWTDVTEDYEEIKENLERCFPNGEGVSSVGASMLRCLAEHVEDLLRMREG